MELTNLKRENIILNLYLLTLPALYMLGIVVEQY